MKFIYPCLSLEDILCFIVFIYQIFIPFYFYKTFILYGLSELKILNIHNIYCICVSFSNTLVHSTQLYEDSLEICKILIKVHHLVISIFGRPMLIGHSAERVTIPPILGSHPFHHPPAIYNFFRDIVGVVTKRINHLNPARKPPKPT